MSSDDSANAALPDRWFKDDNNLLAQHQLDRLRAMLEAAPLIVEHRLYRGGSAPVRLVFDDYDALARHLATARPGDSLYFWSFGDLCRNDNVSLHGKYPDHAGRTPMSGAY